MRSGADFSDELGGTGGGFADGREECAEILRGALELSPVHQVLVEKSIKGYKESKINHSLDRYIWKRLNALSSVAVLPDIPQLFMQDELTSALCSIADYRLADSSLKLLKLKTSLAIHRV